MIEIPNKKVFLTVCGMIILLGLGFFFFTPKQKRLGDDYRISSQNPPEPAQKVQPAEVISKPIEVFFYQKNDTACKNPVSVIFEDLDNRKSFQGITALHALLTHEIPPDYFSALIEGTALNSFRVSQGIAYIDLSTFLTIGSGPCSFEARKSQLIKTMSQFGMYKEIVLMVDGKEVK